MGHVIRRMRSGRVRIFNGNQLMGNVITRNSRTDRRRVFILGGKVGHVTRRTRTVQGQKVKGQGHKVTHKKFSQSRALALVTLESKQTLIVVVAQ